MKALKPSKASDAMSSNPTSWESLLTSYPLSGLEVYESEAGEGVGFVFGFGVRGPKIPNISAELDFKFSL